ncbi:MAG: hypothetical protein LC777_19735, partial [Actinobacteria bacterium]|nr:hypothetical protein [Actinomycetota bacterium]
EEALLDAEGYAGVRQRPGDEAAAQAELVGRDAADVLGQDVRATPGGVSCSPTTAATSARAGSR